MHILKIVLRVIVCFVVMMVGLIVGGVLLNVGPAVVFGAGRWSQFMDTRLGGVLNLAAYTIAAAWFATCFFVAKNGPEKLLVMLGIRPLEGLYLPLPR